MSTDVETRVVRDWAKAGRVYGTAPKSLEIDIGLDGPGSDERKAEPIAAATKGCFLERMLGRSNVVRHRLMTDTGPVDV